MNLQLNFDQQDDPEPSNPVASVKTASQARLSSLNIDDDSNPVMLQIGYHPLELQPSIPATEIDVRHSISVTLNPRDSSKALKQPQASFVDISHDETNTKIIAVPKSPSAEEPAEETDSPFSEAAGASISRTPNVVLYSGSRKSSDNSDRGALLDLGEEASCSPELDVRGTLPLYLCA
jgi:hypothetical protein